MESQTITKISVSLPKQYLFSNVANSTQAMRDPGDSPVHLMLVITLITLKGNVIFTAEKIGFNSFFLMLYKNGGNLKVHGESLEWQVMLVLVLAQF